MLKKIVNLALLSTFTVTSLVACGPNAPSAQVPGTGTNLESDNKVIQGKVTGSKVSSSTMIALYGSFLNLSGNKIDFQNNTVTSDMVLSIAPIADGKYNFALPKAPTKANTAANLRIFAFNDANGNKTYDEGELKSKEGQVRWVVAVGYQSARDQDGNEVLFSEFKDFNFTLE